MIHQTQYTDCVRYGKCEIGPKRPWLSSRPRLAHLYILEGKTPKATRFVGMSDRMFQMLSIWCDGRVEGWVFPSRSKSGHLESIAKGFQAARKNAKLDPRIV